MERLSLQPSPRMAKILKYLTDGQPVWDLCCDHGLIGWNAWQTGRFTEIHFVDQVASIIETLCQRLPADRSHLHVYTVAAQLLDWQRVRGNVVISGVGAHLALDIIRHIPIESPVEVIVSPQKNPQDLRRGLAALDWKIQHDEVVCERGRFRQIIKVARHGQDIHPFGNDLWTRSPEGPTYHASLLAYFQAHQPRMKSELEKLLQIRGL